MKTIYKLLLIVSILTAFVSCKLKEEPPYLQKEDALINSSYAQTALNGVLSAMAEFKYFGADFHHLTDFTSGFFISGKPTDRQNIAKLNPVTDQNYVTNFWQQSYTAIERANIIIDGIDENNDDPEMKNILGTAYFLRGLLYFNLVRLYGGVPLRTEPTTLDNIHLPRASVGDVYALIISDGDKAKELMLEQGSQPVGYPSKYAANMLLAKVYMQLAGNHDGTDPNWQKAYNEAIEVYNSNKYHLVNNYSDLFMYPATADNSPESLFEIQYNTEHSSNLYKLFTHQNAFAGKAWNRIRPNPETVDDHMAKYPNDPRIKMTFISKYNKYGGGIFKTYPEVSNRGAFNKGFPFLYKYFVKNPNQTTTDSNMNFIVYRYADLLLMLAEIKNELDGGPTNAYQFVNEVLARARNSASPAAAEPADWSGLTQDEFREAIMKEYQFELLGEGHDWFNNHRRGYQWFKTHVIDNHNSFTPWKGYDLTYPDDPKVMLLPIPSNEISNNEKISVADQNPGY